MLWWNYEPYISNPDGDYLTLEKDDFLNAFIGVIGNIIVSDLLDYFLGGIPFFCQGVFMLVNFIQVYLKNGDLPSNL